jgi:lipoprotein-anchoring transpeptidase ErfK/SrfK
MTQDLDEHQPSTSSATGPARRAEVRPRGRRGARKATGDAHRAVEPQRSLKALFSLATATVLVLAGGVYAAFATSQYGATAKPGVMIGSLSVGGFDARELRDSVEGLTTQAAIAVSYEDSSERASLADLGVTVDVSATVAAALTANTGSSLISDYTGWIKHAVPLDLQIDDAALDAWVERHFETDSPAARDAEVHFDPLTNAYAVVPGQAGQVFDSAPVRQALEAFALTPQSAPPAALHLTQQSPKIDDAAAWAAADEANKRLGLTLRFSNGAGAQYAATPAEIAAWTTVTPNMARTGLTVSHDQEALERDLRASLEEALSTTAVARRVIVDQAGREVFVAEGGRSATQVGDLKGTLQAVATALENGLSVDLTVPVTQVKAPTIESQLSGPAPTPGKWIDVDLSTQTTTLLEGDQVVANYVISSGKPETPTPPGSYEVYLKVGEQTMRGTEVDGTPYAIPNVTWVTYFSGDYGFHTAYWLDESQIGAPQSHGCINMREPESHFIYDWTAYGTKVIVHD